MNSMVLPEMRFYKRINKYYDPPFLSCVRRKHTCSHKIYICLPNNTKSLWRSPSCFFSSNFDNLLLIFFFCWARGFSRFAFFSTNFNVTKYRKFGALVEKKRQHDYSLLFVVYHMKTMCGWELLSASACLMIKCSLRGSK